MLGPAATAAQALHTGPNIHHHIAALGARAIQLELPANLGAVTHRKVVHHEARVRKVPLLDPLQLGFVEDCFLLRVGADHENVALFAKCEDGLPDVDFCYLAVQDDFFHYGSKILQVPHAGVRSPVQCLRHIITRAERKCDKNYLADIGHGLEHLNGAHDSTITSHQCYYNRRCFRVFRYCLLNHLVPPLVIVSIKHIENVTICMFAMVVKSALNVALLVQEQLGFLVS